MTTANTLQHPAAELNARPQLDGDIDWFNVYRPTPSPSKDHAWTVDDVNYLFDIHGADLEYVLKINAATPDRVWTLVDGDEGSYIVAGYHRVNRMGYFISEVPWTDPNLEILDCSYSDDDFDDDD